MPARQVSAEESFSQIDTPETAKALFAIAESIKGLTAAVIATQPEQLNLVFDIGEFANFDWSSIGVTVTDFDDDGYPTVVSRSGKQYKRRSPVNKFGAAIWFSRAVGKDEANETIYETLVMFKRDQYAPDPLSRQHLAAIGVKG